MAGNTKNFGAYIDRTIKVIRHNYVKMFKALKVDITTEQWVVINALHEQNGISQTELASGSFKNTATVSRIIDLLCNKGLVERKRFENDRRRHKVFLTKEGETLFNKVYPAVLQLRAKGWANLSEEDYDSFLRIINQVFENFQEMKDPIAEND